VAAHGFNPYTTIPDAPALRPLREGRLYPRMGYHGVPTLYPPGAQALFSLAYRLAPSNVLAIKGLIFGCDLATTVLLLALLRRSRRPPALALVYLWNPLVILEFAHSGHVDAAATMCVLAALLATRRDRPWLAGVLLGLATLVKLYPILLLPALLGRRDPRVVPVCVATVGLGYGLAGVVYGGPLFGYLGQYLGRDSINASLYALLGGLGGLLGIPPVVAHRLALLPLATLLLWVARHRWRGGGDPATLLLLITAGYLLLSPSVLPWYVTAGVPLAALAAGRRPGLPAVWIVFSCVVPLEYTHHAYGDDFWPAVLLEYLVVYGLLAVAVLGPGRQAGIGARLKGTLGQLEGAHV
jgi:hypothetical protein